MIKKTIKYEDFNGNTVEEDFYFHISKADLLEMEVGVEGGLSELLKKVAASENPKEILAHYKEIVLSSVGRKSEDGKRFVKTQEIRDEFAQSEAYSELLIELATDAEASAAWVRGVLPGNISIEEATEGKKMPSDRQPKKTTKKS